MKNKIIIVLLVLVIAIGAFIIYKNGFNLDYEYANTKKININFKEAFEIKDVENMAKEVLGNQKFKIGYIDDFKAGVVITTASVTEEQIEGLEAKLKEKYKSFDKNEEENAAEDGHAHNDVLQVIHIPAIKTYDIVKDYMLPMIISAVIVIIFIAIVFHKLGVIKRNFIANRANCSN